MQPDLIARIEAAQPGEARELFEEAAIAAWGVEAGEVVINDTALYERMCRFDDLLDAQAYIDAAAMFVPEGWSVRLIIHPADPSDAPVSYADCYLLDWVDQTVDRGKLKHCEAEATTPYFALLSAAMKARQTDEQ